MSARMTVISGLLSLSVLSGLLIWLKTSSYTSQESSACLPRRQAGALNTSEVLPSACADQGRVAGLRITSINGVDHLVEHHTGPAGYTTLADQLAAINVILNPEDHYIAVPDPSFGIGSSIEITRATPITVFDGGNESTYRTWTTTVKELLTEQKIELGSNDRIGPGFSTLLEQDLKVSITRVGIFEEVESEPIAHKMITKNDDTLDKGVKKIAQKGKDGVRKKTFKVTRENGVVTKRELVGNEISSPPVDQIEVIGIKVIVYGKGQATWYSLRHGFGAASNTLPYGTKVHVVSLASGKSVDVVIDDHGIRGSAIIDLDKEAFEQIAPLGAGRIQVRLEKVY